MASTFLERDEIKDLTGRSQIALQIAALSKMGIPFFVNGVGRPVVTRAAIEGRVTSIPAQAPKKAWVPKVLKTR